MTRWWVVSSESWVVGATRDTSNRRLTRIQRTEMTIRRLTQMDADESAEGSEQWAEQTTHGTQRTAQSAFEICVIRVICGRLLFR